MRIIFAIVFPLAVLLSCQTHRSVGERVFTLRTDTVLELRSVVLRDSVAVRDSTVSDYAIGRYDTVLRVRVDTVRTVRWRTVYRTAHSEAVAAEKETARDSVAHTETISDNGMNRCMALLRLFNRPCLLILVVLVVAVLCFWKCKRR